MAEKRAMAMAWNCILDCSLGIVLRRSLFGKRVLLLRRRYFACRLFVPLYTRGLEAERDLAKE